MKHIFYFMAALLLFTACCSNDDDNNDSDNLLSPPTWIHGTWMIETVGFTFTSNNVMLHNSPVSTDFLETVTNSQGMVTVRDATTNSTYTVYMAQMGQTLTYKFEKVSSTQIKWISSSPITLTKQ